MNLITSTDMQFATASVSGFRYTSLSLPAMNIQKRYQILKRIHVCKPEWVATLWLDDVDAAISADLSTLSTRMIKQQQSAAV